MSRALHRELRILRCILFSWRSCHLSKLTLLLGVSYLFVPIDLIPDRIPVLGHLDEVSFIVFGFVAARRLLPAELVALAYLPPTVAGPSCWQNMQFFVRVLRADLANFFLLQYRCVDGFLITGKNSGTHWLKFMLSRAIARQFNVAPPSHSSGREADRLIGHPKWRRPANVPWIGSSHTIPSIAFAWAWLIHLLPHPPVVVLVRDIEAAMLSNYCKWRGRYGGSIAEYVRGDPTGRRYVADLWWYMHFFNRWGDIARAQPGHVLVVRYEDLLAMPEACLRRIAAHYGIELGDQAIAEALRYVGRDSIRAQLDPSDADAVVPPGYIRNQVVFTPADAAFVHAAVHRHLRWDFGYGYPLAEASLSQPALSAIACSNTPV